jgi:hypothetical protein
MSQILLDSSSNKKWMTMLGVGMVMVVAAVWWARHSLESDRVQDVSSASAQSVQQGSGAAIVSPANGNSANLAPDLVLVAQQAEAAKVIEAQPDMKPIVGPVKERPAYVSFMEWAMLQGVSQQQADPDKELTRMVNFLRFSKQMELLESLAKTPENATKRQVLANQLVSDLPTRVANGEFELKDAQARLMGLLADAVSDPNLRRQREDAEGKRLMIASEAYKATENISQK